MSFQIRSSIKLLLGVVYHVTLHIYQMRNLANILP